MSITDGKEWKVVYRSTQAHKVNIVKAVLEDNGIRAVDLSKKDSAYTMLGEIELYVQPKDEVLARFLIKNNDL
jgi:hypothetical protein